jgi:hypothetical protein
MANSEHRDGADVACLQPAGDGGGCAQGHQTRLLHRLAAAAEVDRDAGLGSSLYPTRVDVHEHLADRAAEGGGGHGRDGEEHRSPAPQQRPCQGRRAACVSPGGAEVVGQCWVRGSPLPWLDPGVLLVPEGCWSPGIAA